MVTKRILVFILLGGLLVSCAAGAQVAHEDPESVPVREPYDADRKLALSLQEMFGSMDRFVAHANASEFPASRQDIRLFMASYEDFAGVYGRSGLNGTDMEAIAGMLASMSGDLNATLESAESYSVDLQRFRDYVNASDPQNATGLAAKLQLTYRNVSGSIRTVREKSAGVLALLDDTDIDTSALENEIAGLGSFTASVEENNRKPSGMLGNASLVLSASSGEVSAGDLIALSGVLRVDGTLPGRLIRFFVDGAPAGNARTDGSGVCTLVYPVDGRSFNRTMRASAEFDPEGGLLSPAVSNSLVIARRPEAALLWSRVTPETAAYGDVVEASGRLTAASGVPAANQAVTVSVAGIPAGIAVTGVDGTFTLPLTIGYGMPAGDCPVAAGYGPAPDCVLTNATSSPAILRIARGVSTITLDPLPPSCRGGESVVFRGSLAAGDGQPVTGAKVAVFAGDVPLGVSVTDASGRYSLDKAVPYDVSPGSQGVYASFDPGEGRALAGSQSAIIPVLFEPSAPQISITGIPLVLFPGDGLNATGIVMAADGTPINGTPVSLSIPGAAAATAVTDASGSYRITGVVGGGPGIYRLSARVPGPGLLSGEGPAAATVIVMPLDRAGTAFFAILALLAASLGVLKVRRDRLKTMTAPVPVEPLPAVVERVARPAAGSIEAELRKVEPAITGDGDRREAMLSIYRVTRLILRDRDPSLPPSATHRELCRLVAGKRPSLAASLDVIAGRYEAAAFGHFPLTREEVVRSLRSLDEIRVQLYDEGGSGP